MNFDEGTSKRGEVLVVVWLFSHNRFFNSSTAITDLRINWVTNKFVLEYFSALLSIMYIFMSCFGRSGYPNAMY